MKKVKLIIDVEVTDGKRSQKARFDNLTAFIKWIEGAVEDGLIDPQQLEELNG